MNTDNHGYFSAKDILPLLKQQIDYLENQIAEKCGMKLYKSSNGFTQEEIYEYFRINFPIRASLVRVLDETKILIGAGREQGIKEGDKFVIESIEIIGNKPYPTTIGEAKVKKLAGDSFSESDVSKKMVKIISDKLSANAEIRCSLVIKK